MRSSASPIYPKDLLELVEEYLADIEFECPKASAGLVEAMRYSLLAGGKRIRPVLCLAAARSLSVDVEGLLPTAASLELIHTYSLVHDDLPPIDNDDLRRGKPTLHRAFGEDVAILAGDALFAEAIGLVVKVQQGSPERKLAIMEEINRATAVAGMAGGQYIDIHGSEHLDEAGLSQMHRMKTGRLIEASVRCALLFAKTDPAVEEAYAEFASELGLLFQIVDDILDETGSDEELGRAAGSDRRLGKQTYVTLHGLERARELATKSYERATAALNRTDNRCDDLHAIADLIYGRSR